ncbi:hypothetical protein [uncultured Cohaesibacter sp.]|nr:hypothetical protein [uncultured Cohaesibacter sp.]
MLWADRQIAAAFWYGHAAERGETVFALSNFHCQDGRFIAAPTQIETI